MILLLDHCLILNASTSEILILRLSAACRYEFKLATNFHYGSTPDKIILIWTELKHGFDLLLLSIPLKLLLLLLLRPEILLLVRVILRISSEFKHIFDHLLLREWLLLCLWFLKQTGFMNQLLLSYRLLGARVVISVKPAYHIKVSCIHITVGYICGVQFLVHNAATHAIVILTPDVIPALVGILDVIIGFLLLFYLLVKIIDHRVFLDSPVCGLGDLLAHVVAVVAAELRADLRPRCFLLATTATMSTATHLFLLIRWHVGVAWLLVVNLSLLLERTLVMLNWHLLLAGEHC